MGTRLLISGILVLFLFSFGFAGDDVCRAKTKMTTSKVNTTTVAVDGDFFALKGIKYHKCTWWCEIRAKFFGRCCVGYKSRQII